MKNNLTMLIVEDEFSIRSLMEIEFQDLGYETISVGLVSEAQQIINNKEQEIDLCILDLRLPDGDGLTLLQKVKDAYPNIPVILMTGHGNKSTVIEALKRGAYDYIEKPFSISNELFPIVHRAEAAIHLQKENTSLNEQILHNSKLAVLGELSATVLHDIRGPLSLIQVVCDDMQEELNYLGKIENHSITEHLSHIRKAGNRIKKLVDHLRAYSRQDKQEQREKRQLELLIDDSLFLIQQKIRKYTIKQNKNIAKELKGSEIFCYPNKFEQVIMNLCSNACDAMATSQIKELTVSTYVQEDFVYIEIKDSGSGMTKEIQDKIFDNFFTTKPRGEGTGLGLKIVRNIIREHEVELLLKSEVNVGTIFSVKIPIRLITFVNNNTEESLNLVA